MDAIERDWSRIEAWLGTNLPPVLNDLNPGASDEQLTRLERHLSQNLPEAWKALYHVCNGQRQESHGVFFGNAFLDLERVAADWDAWNDIVIHDPASALGADLPFTSTPEGAVQLRYADAGWLPFTANGMGDHFGVDLHPGPSGRHGQVIYFGRNIRNKVVVAPDLAAFIGWVADELERGKGRVHEASGMQLFDHADLGDGNPEDGLRRILYGT